MNQSVLFYPLPHSEIFPTEEEDKTLEEKAAMWKLRVMDANKNLVSIPRPVVIIKVDQSLCGFRSILYSILFY